MSKPATNRRRRPPAVAGRFYPDDPDEVRRAVASYVACASGENSPRAEPRPGSGHSIKAVIAPHAGYIYSGPVAGHAYAQLAPLRDRIERVVLIGPAHYVAFRGLATSSADEFATPLGSVPLDREAIGAILALPQVAELDAAHAPDHALEVQLPFLQECLADFSLVPLLVGDSSTAEVAEVFEKLWGGDETLFVISSDLSHFLDYRSAGEIDRRTAAAIEQLDADAIGDNQACGRLAIKGLICCARDHRLSCRRLDLRNSGDTAGPRDSVVGYGAFAFES